MYRKMAEIAAQFAELETAYNESPVGLAVLDTELRFRRVNPRLAAMNGISVEGHIGKTVGELLPGLEAAARSLGREIIETGRPKLDIELSGETPSHPGEIRYWCEQWAPVKDSSGKVVAIAISVEDITERKRVEGALEASQRELEHRVAELETLMASAPAAILVAHDAQCTHLTGNREAEKMFGFGAGDSITDSTFEAFETLPFPEHRAGKRIPRENFPIETAARTGSPVRNAELTLRFKDGSEKYISGNAHPLFNSDGTVRGVIGAFDDITARKRAEHALAQELRNKDAFLATLSHEMRNPLSALAAGIEALAAKAVAQPDLRKFPELLSRQEKQLTRLVNDLLDISRIGRGQIVLDCSNFKLSDALRSAIQATDALRTRRKQSLNYVEAPEGVTVNADAARITQVITNLLHNASKFSPTGSVIDIELRVEKDMVVIVVADHGPGIANGRLPQIFDRFFTATVADERTPGLGIGLWLSRELVMLHGGVITAANRTPGPGAQFTVELPISCGCAQ